MTPLHHQTCGHGPEVVLLHGWGMHSDVWEDLIEELLDHYRITILDLPGHGRSRNARFGPSLDDLGETVAAVAPLRATWIGWSLGGLIAQWLAIAAPERVERLVLVGSTPCFTQRPDWPHGMAPAVLRGFAEELRRNHRATLLRFIALEVRGSNHAAAQLRQLKALLFQYGEPDETALENGLAILEHTDLRGGLPRVRCPTLLLLGQRDLLAPVAAGVAMREFLPDARLHVFPHAGHAPFLSHLPEFLTELRIFLDARRP